MKLNPVAYTGVLFIVSLSTAALSHKRVCICQDILWQLVFRDMRVGKLFFVPYVL